MLNLIIINILTTSKIIFIIIKKNIKEIFM